MLVKTLDDFYNYAEFIGHFAVKRPLKYFHHFIITSWKNGEFGKKDEEDTKTEESKQKKKRENKSYEYYVNFVNFIHGIGVVKESPISEMEIKHVIGKGLLYVIEGPDYPKTIDQKKEAQERYKERVGENEYALAYNNCEHVVSYILTGKPFSQQIRDAGVWLMVVIDSFDSLLLNGRSKVKLTGGFIAALPVYFYGKPAANMVVKFAEKITKNAIMKGSGKQILVNKGTMTLCKEAGGKLGCSAEKLLQNKNCAAGANQANIELLGKAAVTTFAVTGIIEGANAYFEIQNLIKLEKKGHITKEQYDREEAKRIFEAVGATTGSTIGGVIGQSVIPVPYLGCAIGTLSGEIFGRWLYSACTGQVYDAFSGK